VYPLLIHGRAGGIFRKEVTMRGYQLTAILEREGDLFVAHCLELDLASRGFSGVAALANLKEVVTSFLANAQDAEILERLVREVEVMPFDIERT
jgi:putative NADH-flavin reductase